MEHEEEESFIEGYLHVVTDPGHIAAELTFTLFFDIIIVLLIGKVVLKRYVYPRWTKKVHAEIDQSHGYVHTQGAFNEEVHGISGNRIGSSSPSVRVFWPIEGPVIGAGTDSDGDRSTTGSKSVGH